MFLAYYYLDYEVVGDEVYCICLYYKTLHGIYLVDVYYLYRENIVSLLSPSADVADGNDTGSPAGEHKGATSENSFRESEETLQSQCDSTLRNRMSPAPSRSGDKPPPQSVLTKRLARRERRKERCRSRERYAQRHTSNEIHQYSDGAPPEGFQPVSSVSQSVSSEGESKRTGRRPKGNLGTRLCRIRLRHTGYCPMQLLTNRHHEYLTAQLHRRRSSSLARSLSRFTEIMPPCSLPRVPLYTNEKKLHNVFQ